MAVSSVLRTKAQPQPSARNIRRADLRDIPELIEFKRLMSIADGAPGLCDATHDDWARDGFGPASRFAVFVASAAGGPLDGMAAFNEQAFCGWASPVIYVQDLFVRPPLRRQGIGRALLEQVAAEAQTRRARFVYLNVHQDNPARRLYRGLGFVDSRQCQVHVLFGAALEALAAAAPRR